MMEKDLACLTRKSEETHRNLSNLADKISVWGNSLSYASADNSAGSASPVTLADTLIGDNSEFYGNCSCWDSGCGEFDIFEVLDSGGQKCKSTWHNAHAKGDSNWIQRPITGTQKAAVIFDGDASIAHIVLLPADTDFSTNLARTTVSGFINSIQDPNLNIQVALDSR
ncbi:uncharacterized protein A1O5_13289 [Cladophialophora psammophila CBS 110553]|uniref:Cell wall protein YJL171C/Tos1 C-terminal domain-containing protein n=1 Tax=Cladophialophora psammophila CBS 110553 TaxID=1182543 RepID=W9VDH6_9EURO|nr:uncharacterized protein A1O5_13289 [Cladophialophora psammophila CBS 110553]EXJ53513.1 hypothetical protein A1O5_13289 [Cladophialophora psammophila CBS 110553]